MAYEKETADAIALAEDVKVEQEKRDFPLQTLRGGGKPSDVAEFKTWRDADPGYDSWVDVYNGPFGVGYVVNIEIDQLGVKFRKAIGFGPEKRDQDWTEVVIPPELGKEK